MSTKNSNGGLIAAIIFASVVISGSLVFFGIKYFDKPNQQEIFDGIDAYIKVKQTEATTAQQQAEAEANQPKYVGDGYEDDDPVLGDKNAPITIVEFSDYECPYCEAFYSDAYKQIKAKYIDTGKVKFVYRDYPLSFHPDAYPAALFANCVREQKGDAGYFAAHDQIFETIDKGFDFNKMSRFAVGLGVDAKKLKTCFDTDKYKDEIEADEQAGVDIGITGTPGFIVDGWILKGAQPFEAFAEIIDKR